MFGNLKSGAVLAMVCVWLLASCCLLSRIAGDPSVVLPQQ
jgi:hypothetical protein